MQLSENSCNSLITNTLWRPGRRKSLTINNLWNYATQKKPPPEGGGEPTTYTNTSLKSFHQFAFLNFHVKRILDMIANIETDLAIKNRM